MHCSATHSQGVPAVLSSTSSTHAESERITLALPLRSAQQQNSITAAIIIATSTTSSTITEAAAAIIITTSTTFSTITNTDRMSSNTRKNNSKSAKEPKPRFDDIQEAKAFYGNLAWQLDCIKELGKSLGLKSLVGSHRASTSWPGQNGQVQKVLRDLKAILQTKYRSNKLLFSPSKYLKVAILFDGKKNPHFDFRLSLDSDDLIGYPFSNDDMYRTIANISKQVYEMILQSVQKEKETHGGAPDKAPNHLITTQPTPSTSQPDQQQQHPPLTLPSNHNFSAAHALDYLRENCLEYEAAKNSAKIQCPTILSRSTGAYHLIDASGQAAHLKAQQQAQSLLQQRQWPLPLVNVNENHFIDDLNDFVEEEEERRLARENQRRVVVKAEAEEEEEEVPREEAGPSPSDALLRGPLPAEEGVWPASPASPSSSLLAAYDEELFRNLEENFALLERSKLEVAREDAAIAAAAAAAKANMVVVKKEEEEEETIEHGTLRQLHQLDDQPCTCEGDSDFDEEPETESISGHLVDSEAHHRQFDKLSNSKNESSGSDRIDSPADLTAENTDLARIFRSVRPVSKRSTLEKEEEHEESNGTAVARDGGVGSTLSIGGPSLVTPVNGNGVSRSGSSEAESPEAHALGNDIDVTHKKLKPINLITIHLHIDNTNLLVAGFIKAKIFAALQKVQADPALATLSPKIPKPLELVTPNIYGSEDTPMGEWLLPGTLVLVFTLNSALLPLPLLTRLKRAPVFDSLQLGGISRPLLVAVFTTVQLAIMAVQLAITLLVVGTLLVKANQRDYLLNSLGLSFVLVAQQGTVALLLSTVALFALNLRRPGLVVFTSVAAEGLRSVFSRGWGWQQYHHLTTENDVLWWAVNLPLAWIAGLQLMTMIAHISL
ncbi:hypothetical protein TYRP_008540 [Tyrophagus putrescentiae]|nr:hypothetical protein TYRP_008540 [Tyrophagus putrescentiae]